MCGTSSIVRVRMWPLNDVSDMNRNATGTKES